jgi:hypothetical protein
MPQKTAMQCAEGHACFGISTFSLDIRLQTGVTKEIIESLGGLVLKWRTLYKKQFQSFKIEKKLLLDIKFKICIAMH